MGDRPHYVRVYYSINDDPRFDTIRTDDARLATWLRLLMIADAVWPASADLPRWVKPKPLKALADAKIVEIMLNDRFRIHGLDNEREQRRLSASVGGRANAERLLSDRSPNGIPSRAEQSKSRDEHRVRMNGSSPKCAVDPGHPMVESSYGRWWCAVCEERVPA